MSETAISKYTSLSIIFATIFNITITILNHNFRIIKYNDQ